jgi:outer membrane receptor protein involved in Fe transport
MRRHIYMRLFFVILLAVTCPIAALGQGNGVIKGVLVDKVSGEPVMGAPVWLDDQEPVEVSDELGRFRFGGVKPGRHEILIRDPVHIEFRASCEVSAGEVTELRYALDPMGKQEMQEVIIRSERLEDNVSDTVLEVEEVKKIPGTQGDIVKIIQSLPGVARNLAIGGTSGVGVVVRGAAPEDSEVLIDGHGVPLLYHFGQIKSVLNSDMLKRIDFMPGGFGAEFGDAIGGVIDVQTRPCNTKRFDGYVELSMLDAGFFLEGPISDEVGFIAAARRSTVDMWLPEVLPELLPEQVSLDLTVAPYYWDYQTKVEWIPSTNNRFYMLVFGSHDELSFLFERPMSSDPSLRGDFGMWIDFHRIYAVWVHSPDPDWELRWSLVGGLDRAHVQIGELRYIDFYVPNVSSRADLQWKISDRWKFKAGVQTGLIFYESDLSMPRPPKEGEVPGKFQTMELIEGQEKLTAFGLSAYATLGFAPTEKLLLTSGLRLESYADPINDAVVMPRFSLSYKVRPGTVFLAGVGLYRQTAQEDELSESFGNPDLKLERAWHFTIGLEQQLPAKVKLEVQYFYKILDKLVVTDKESIYTNAGIGKIAGLEVLIRRELAQDLFGWLAYTLMQSKRKDGPDEPWRLFSFDQTHILTLVLGYKLPTGPVQPNHGRQDGWDFGLRFQLVSGNPATPLIGGYFDSDYDTYLPVPGPINSERLPLYHRLDLRVDYTWAFTTWALTVFLDVQNVYNYEAVEGIRYNYDFTERAYIEGLPIIPYLGIIGSF